MKKVAYKVLLAAFIFLLGFSFARLLPAANPPPKPQPSLAVIASAASNVSVMVDFENGKVTTLSAIPWHQGMTAFDALKYVADKQSMKLEYKDYGGDMGVFIQSINGIKDPKNKAWWQFWVNNAYSQKGASSTPLKSGDNIEWKLLAAQQ